MVVVLSPPIYISLTFEPNFHVFPPFNLLKKYFPVSDKSCFGVYYPGPGTLRFPLNEPPNLCGPDFIFTVYGLLYLDTLSDPFKQSFLV